MLDFGGPSDSYYCSFVCKIGLNTIVCASNIVKLEGGHGPQSPLDPPLLVLKHEVIVAHSFITLITLVG